MKFTKFCCQSMESAIRDPDLPVIFTPKFREFGIRVLDGGSSTLGLVFCPWCGQKLPGSLRDRWFDELQQLDVDPYGQNVPPEFADEQWYQNKVG